MASDPYIAEVGRYVQALRGEMDLSQAQLAKRAGINAGTLSGLETGARWPRVTRLARIEQALGLRSGALGTVRKQAEAGQEVLPSDAPQVSAA